MISSLHGTLELLGNEWAIINVGGIGFKVYMPTGALSELSATGQDVKIYTHLHVREDNVTLYGFSSIEELELFETLITVSGAGPKLALAMLSAMDVEKLTMAIATGNADLLTGIPGIGKKTANRIILELKDKISAGWITTPASQLVQGNSDVLAALTSLGYSLSEANRAAANIPASSDLTLEDKIRLALQYFGGK